MTALQREGPGVITDYFCDGCRHLKSKPCPLSTWNHDPSLNYIDLECHSPELPLDIPKLITEIKLSHPSFLLISTPDWCPYYNIGN